MTPYKGLLIIYVNISYGWVGLKNGHKMFTIVYDVYVNSFVGGWVGDLVHQPHIHIRVSFVFQI